MAFGYQSTVETCFDYSVIVDDMGACVCKVQ